MQPDNTQHARTMLWRIAQKEISLFFASPVSYLFLGGFLAVVLFMFFWGEAFFARNIADVRPLFNAMPLLLPVTRDLGGFRVQEVRMLDYPYFIDVRQNGLNAEHPATASLQQLTLNWASPLAIDADKNSSRKVTELIHSSNRAWLSDSTQVLPPLNQYGELSFTPEGEQQSYLLGAVVEGEFSSYFAGKDSPLLAAADEANKDAAADEPALNVSSVLSRSPSSARLIVLSSNDFISDTALQLSGAASGVQDIAALQLIANTLDWALDDAALTSIRARGQFNRTLLPMDEGSQQFWEYLNYAIAVLLLVALILLQRASWWRNSVPCPCLNGQQKRPLAARLPSLMCAAVPAIISISW